MAHCFPTSPKPADRGTTLLRGQGLRTPKSAPSGLVGARIRQLTSIANRHSAGIRPAPFTVEQDLEDEQLGLRRRADRRLGSPPSRNVASPENMLGTVGPSSSTQPLDMANGRQGAARDQPLIDTSPNWGSSVLSDMHRPSNPTTKPSNNMEPLSSTSRPHDAMAMFDLYGVSRPVGWRSKDRIRPGSRTKQLQICHSCGENLHSGAQCSKCGHGFCSKCAAEVPRSETPSLQLGSERGDQAQDTHSPSRHSFHGSERAVYDTSDKSEDFDTRVSNHPTESDALSQHRMLAPAPDTGFSILGSSNGPLLAASTDNADLAGQSRDSESKRSIRNNPFMKTNTTGKGKATSPQATSTNARARKPRRLSDCVPRRLMDRSSSTDSEDCRWLTLESRPNDPATYEKRHPICCTAHRGVANKPSEDRCSSETDGSLHDVLHRKIDQLYQHAEQLHSSRNAMKNLASALESLDRDAEASRGYSGISTLTSPSRDARATDQLQGHLLDEDPKTPVASSVSCHDLETDVKAARVSPLRLHRLEMDDVFGSHSSDQSENAMHRHGIRGVINGQEGENTDVDDDTPPDCPDSEPNQWQDTARHTEIAYGDTEATHPTAPLIGLEFKEGPAGQPGTGGSRRCDATFNLDLSSSVAPETPQTARSDKIVSPLSSAAGQDIPSMTGGLGHRRGTTLCQPPQDNDPEPEPWPVLRRVDRSGADSAPRTPDPIPWSRDMLRKVASCAEAPRQPGFAASPQSWRRGLRRIESRNEPTPPVGAVPATPASQWRQSLVQARETPSRAIGNTNICSFCDPKSMPPPPGVRWLTGICNHATIPQTKQPANLPWLDESVTPTRVRVRQVEQDLAMKRAEELEAEAKEGERAVCDLATLRADKDEKWVAPDGHNCAWRDRYMDLNTELEKWKNEATFHDLERDQAGEEESTKVAKDAAAQVTRRRSADEVGIEGLTIVVHMRYKDDVVINTDLKDRGTGSVHSRRKM